MNQWGWLDRLALCALGVLFLWSHRLFLGVICREAQKIMSKMDALKAEVTAFRDVSVSAIALIRGLKTQLSDALEAENPDDAVQSVIDDLRASELDLAAAVAANTSAAPAAESGATSNTSSPAPADLPDGHPLKPVVSGAIPVSKPGDPNSATAAAPPVHDDPSSVVG